MLPKCVSAGEGKQICVVGDLISFKVASNETGGAFALIETHAPPGGGPPRHVHSREDETFYVLEGEVEFYLGERTVRVAAGGTVFAPRGIPHTYHNVGRNACRMLCFCTPGGIERFFEELALIPPGEVDQMRTLGSRYGIAFV